MLTKVLAVGAAVGLVIYVAAIRLAIFLGALCAIFLFASVLADGWADITDRIRPRRRRAAA